MTQPPLIDPSMLSMDDPMFNPAPPKPIDFTFAASNLIDCSLEIGAIYSKDPESLHRKVERILADGGENLHIISDFDMTLTKYWIKDRKTGEKRRGVSSHGVMKYMPGMTLELLEKEDALVEKYYPIEMSPHLTVAQKIPHMEAWWNSAHDILASINLSRSDLTSTLKNYPFQFREGAKELLHAAHERGVEVSVFSAGVGDVIVEGMKPLGVPITQDLSAKGEGVVKVVANRMKWTGDEPEDKCVGFHDPLIHSFNKGEHTLSSPSEPTEPNVPTSTSHRPNVLLLGDSLGDIHMKDGYPHKNSLSVGFLNVDEDMWLDRYLEVFDVVISGEDESMDWVSFLIGSLSVKEEKN
ncbi:UMPH-1-domain-containing protein [Saitoella complicata NRRL Y-17804]|uniref:5'-nucleotidase n=1 Tax=Saitoella complicata (strain BCRC 22490 / CBS 7301 / JCM 7358 / NBRC 10748 / NRRL Y-17804) TaxID=698492 RepID=A0A0E9NK79_SAICN|nr:UMPH-1-domain-containing protein [Saitoella complicata NRRL Y-17804]ODQ50233.1 UMPH-1-domain-containing protein [Saitoella complicata NRRL Y-17804]GAO50213.1 hypothetical protein G7K_4345-t1 [Saitoella complicata NRRL Y-17804]